jgi:copper(I)-binding protein
MMFQSRMLKRSHLFLTGCVALSLAWSAAVAASSDKAVSKPAPKTSAASVAVKVQVSEAWIRPAVKGQSGTGGFMNLMSPEGATLVGFSTPIAEMAELHEMAMQGDVMRMRPIESLALPAGQTVGLKPGGHHLMLMGLKKPLKAGEHIQLTLKLKAADGKMLTQTIQVPVQSAPVAPAASAASAAASEAMHHAH